MMEGRARGWVEGDPYSKSRATKKGRVGKWEARLEWSGLVLSKQADSWGGCTKRLHILEWLTGPGLRYSGGGVPSRDSTGSSYCIVASGIFLLAQGSQRVLTVTDLRGDSLERSSGVAWWIRVCEHTLADSHLRHDERIGDRERP
jgi:hypothetical protein